MKKYMVHLWVGKEYILSRPREGCSKKQVREEFLREWEDCKHLWKAQGRPRVVVGIIKDNI